MEVNNILDSLNDVQREAVAYCDGPQLVIAGAGSGKTRVLTYKIAYLLQHDVMPWNILALTFTNKAAAEMRERIRTLVGGEMADRLWMGTFHSIFAHILRREASHIGMTPDYTIYDAQDSRSLVKTIIKEMELDEKVYKPATIANRISTAKNELVGPEAYALSRKYQEHDQMAGIPMTHEIYTRYAARCRNANAMDFDDLLLYTYRLFADNAEVRKKYESQFHYVLVDEYQDTNLAQHQIVWLLTEHNQRICVVGDDAQSIYSFRGANIDNILLFQQRYQSAKLFKLEQNYRSTQTIVKAANSIIRKNDRQIEKNLYSENLKGERISIVHLVSDLEESHNVARRILNMHMRDHIPYNQIAILYRTNNQTRQLEEALRRLSIPYIIYGGLSFYQRKEIKDVVAYMRLAVNPNDEEALRRVINYPPRGIGDTTLHKIFDMANTYHVCPMTIVSNPTGYGLNVNKGTAKKLTDFADMIDEFNVQAEELDAESLTRNILGKTTLAALINHGTEPEDKSRQENLQELLDAISSFVIDRSEQGLPTRLTDFLQIVSLMSDLDDTPDKDKIDKSEGTVTLMTVHASKGLEFRVVFVVGLEEELFPNQMAIEEGPRGIEEERRLMYVAMTRACEQLILTTCQNRYRYGKNEVMNPSRFLAEIDPALTESVGMRHDGDTTHPGHTFGGNQNGRNRPYSRKPLGVTPFGTLRQPLGNTMRSEKASTSYGHTSFAPHANRPSPTTIRAPWEENNKPSSAPPASSQQGTITTSHLPSSVHGHTLRRVSSYTSTPSSVGNSDVDLSRLHVGTRIQHNRFGLGEVLHIEGTGIDAKIRVRFHSADGQGPNSEKQLMLKFAKFTIIE